MVKVGLAVPELNISVRLQEPKAHRRALLPLRKKAALRRFGILGDHESERRPTAAILRSTSRYLRPQIP